MKRYRVGFLRGLLYDQNRPNWEGDGFRPLRWSAWYPAAEDAVEETVLLPPERPLFIMGTVAPDAELTKQGELLPVILLSHGTGGTAVSLGWLAQALAAAGCVVIGVNHHGNTASEPYKAEGFLCWWERSPDLSVALDKLSREGPFAGRLDLERVACAGFSLGGYTALSLAGAITDMEQFRTWAGATPFRNGPREFPDLGECVEPLLRQSAVFQAAWERQAASFADPRIGAVAALAPAPPIRAFTQRSLAVLGPPVTILAGGADREAPADLCAEWLHHHLPGSCLHRLGRDVGHYTLLPEATEEGRRLAPELSVDAPGVGRSAVHRHSAAIVLAAFREPLRL